jgi:hypothetical protein
MDRRSVQPILTFNTDRQLLLLYAYLGKWVCRTAALLAEFSAFFVPNTASQADLSLLDHLFTTIPAIPSLLSWRS